MLVESIGQLASINTVLYSWERSEFRLTLGAMLENFVVGPTLVKDFSDVVMRPTARGGGLAAKPSPSDEESFPSASAAGQRSRRRRRRSVTCHCSSCLSVVWQPGSYLEALHIQLLLQLVHVRNAIDEMASSADDDVLEAMAELALSEAEVVCQRSPRVTVVAGAFGVFERMHEAAFGHAASGSSRISGDDKITTSAHVDVNAAIDDTTMEADGDYDASVWRAAHGFLLAPVLTARWSLPLLDVMDAAASSSDDKGLQLDNQLATRALTRARSLIDLTSAAGRTTPSQGAMACDDSSYLLTVMKNPKSAADTRFFAYLSAVARKTFAKSSNLPSLREPGNVRGVLLAFHHALASANLSAAIDLGSIILLIQSLPKSGDSADPNFIILDSFASDLLPLLRSSHGILAVTAHRQAAMVADGRGSWESSVSSVLGSDQSGSSAATHQRWYSGLVSASVAAVGRRAAGQHTATTAAVARRIVAHVAQHANVMQLFAQDTLRLIALRVTQGLCVSTSVGREAVMLHGALPVLMAHLFSGRSSTLACAAAGALHSATASLDVCAALLGDGGASLMMMLCRRLAGRDVKVDGDGDEDSFVDDDDDSDTEIGRGGLESAPLELTPAAATESEVTMKQRVARKCLRTSRQRPSPDAARLTAFTFLLPGTSSHVAVIVRRRVGLDDPQDLLGIHFYPPVSVAVDAAEWHLLSGPLRLDVQGTTAKTASLIQISMQLHVLGMAQNMARERQVAAVMREWGLLELLTSLLVAADSSAVKQARAKAPSVNQQDEDADDDDAVMKVRVAAIAALLNLSDGADVHMRIAIKKVLSSALAAALVAECL